MSDELQEHSEILADKAAKFESKVTSTLYNGKKTGTNFANDKTSLGGGQNLTTKKLPDLHLTYNSAGETMAGGVKPSRTLVGQTSDSEQETNAYQGQSIKMPLIKAGS